MECLRETAAPGGPAPRLGGRGVLRTRQSLPMECLPGTAASLCPGPPAGHTESTSQAPVEAYGARVGNGSPQQLEPTKGGDVESCPCGRHCLWSAGGGWRPPRLGPASCGDGESCPRGGRCLWSAYGTAAPSGARPPAGWTGGRAHVAVGAYGAPAGDGSPQRHGPGTLGDTGGSRYLWSACGGRQLPSVPAHELGGWGVVARRRSLLMERLRETAAPSGPGHQLGGRRVLPGRRPLPMERLLGLAEPSGPGPRAGGSSHRRRLSSWGDRGSYRGGGRCFWST